MQCQQRINARSVVTSTRQQHAAGVVRARVSRGSRVMVEARSLAFVQRSVVSRALAAANRGSRSLRLVVSAVKDGAPLAAWLAHAGHCCSPHLAVTPCSSLA